MWVQTHWSHKSFEMLPAVKNSVVVSGLWDRTVWWKGIIMSQETATCVVSVAPWQWKEQFPLKAISSWTLAHIHTHTHTHTHTHEHTLRSHRRPQFRYCNYALSIHFYCVTLEDLGEDARGMWFGSIVELDWILLAVGKVHRQAAVTVLNFMFP
jgi:hypothetical protein